MVARPGREQAAFTAGELDTFLHARTELKYYSSGMSRAENILCRAQGGFDQADGLRRRRGLPAGAKAGVDFTASNGQVYDLIFDAALIRVIDADNNEVDTVAHPYTAAQLDEVTFAQRLDTLLIFHPDVQTRRLRVTPSDWVLDNAPFSNLMNVDYGAVYSNGVAAVWEIEFIGFGPADGDNPAVADRAFAITISQQETRGLKGVMGTVDTTRIDWSATAPVVQAALLDLPNIAPGLTCTWPGAGEKLVITFSGAANAGNDWAVSGRVLNKADAAILAYRSTPGVAPGEPVASALRGWPRCGVFHQQRLAIGGFRSQPNSYAWSSVGDYYNFDDRLDQANGAFLVQMDTPGGEAVERLVSSQNLLVFTSEAEYWLSEQQVSKSTPAKHIQASRHGSPRAVSIVENEGAALFAYANRGIIGEFRYTDTQGNYITSDVSILAGRLVRGTTDLALRRATADADGNTLAVLLDGGELRLATLLREQDVTSFHRRTTDGRFLAIWANGRNELNAIVERPVGAGVERSLERFEPGLLLDGAIDVAPAGNAIGGLSMHEGRPVWVLADGDVFGPIAVAGGVIALPIEAESATVGRWRPPVASSLPPRRDVGPNIVVQRPTRIVAVDVDVEDTTSLAIATNGGRAYDLPLDAFGLEADRPELGPGLTGLVAQSGLEGYADRPVFTATQVRPGRLRVKSWNIKLNI